MDKKNIFIQANCQGTAFKNVFNRVQRLNNKYAILDIKPVHLWLEEDKDYIVSKLKICDIFLHQPVHEINFGIYGSESLKQYLKIGNLSISFPNLYFTGYHPQAFYLKDDQGKKVSEPFEYHDQNIVNMFKNGKSINEIENIFEDEKFYSEEVIIRNIDKSLQELIEREKSTDIVVSDHIRKNMFGKKLFHIFNHPTNEMIFFLVDRILENLNEDMLLDEEKKLFKGELLGVIEYPIYKSVQRYLHLNTESVQFVQKKEILPLRSVIEQYFDVYNRLPLSK